MPLEQLTHQEIENLIQITKGGIYTPERYQYSEEQSLAAIKDLGNSKNPKALTYLKHLISEESLAPIQTGLTIIKDPKSETYVYSEVTFPNAQGRLKGLMTYRISKSIQSKPWEASPPELKQAKEEFQNPNSRKPFEHKKEIHTIVTKAIQNLESTLLSSPAY